MGKHSTPSGSSPVADGSSPIAEGSKPIAEGSQPIADGSNPIADSSVADGTNPGADSIATGTCPLADRRCTVGEQFAVLHEEIRDLREQVSTDSLTGLSNVRHLRVMLEQEMERTKRNHQPTTFLILDVDHFKAVNDTYGHVVGDKALQHLATLIKTVVRKIDIPCRYGGEEFGVILPSTPILVGIQVAERVRKLVEETPLIEGEHTIALTISLGVETYSQSSRDSIEELIARADTELYRAKQSGRNCVCFASKHTVNKAEVTQSEKDALFNQLNDDSLDVNPQDNE